MVLKGANHGQNVISFYTPKILIWNQVMGLYDAFLNIWDENNP